MTPRFANILFSGPCNLRCPACIGQQPGVGRDRPANLDRYPLAGQERFVQALMRQGVREVTLTGTNTDPLLYRHLDRLITALQARVPGVRLNLHTNGMAAPGRMAVINRCHRVCVSVPSFEPDTIRRLTGTRRGVDLAALVTGARIPVKVSVLLSPHNLEQIPRMIRRCRELGVRRMVLRQPYPGPGDLEPLPGREPARIFAGNPVYEVDGMEVTVWDFAATQLRCINLYSDGSITGDYLLARA